MMGSPGDGGDNFTTLVSLLADPKQYQDKLKALEKAKRDANTAQAQAVDAIKKSEAAKADADKAAKGLADRYDEIDHRTSQLESWSRELQQIERDLNLRDSKLAADKNDFEASRRTAEEAVAKRTREVLDREAAVNKREAEADAEITRQKNEFEKERLSHRQLIDADRAAAAAARKEADGYKEAALKLRAEHQSRLDKLVALASGR